MSNVIYANCRFSGKQWLARTKRASKELPDYGPDTVVDMEDDFSMKQIENGASRTAEEAFQDMMGHVFLQDWLKAGNGRIADEYDVTIGVDDEI